ncbi:hypothetical protein KZY98_14530, partial [Croceibacter atlanticus]|nr:hypothetical protein [Croceibacter atlanticus]
NNAQERRDERPANGLVGHFPRKTCGVCATSNNQTCRRKKAGNFPAAASYTRFLKGSPRQAF